MPARRFVLHHLTRSGRLTYGSLERRDSSFIHQFDEWFAEQTPGDATVQPPAQQPLQLGDTVLDNRFVRALEPTMSAEEGRLSVSQRAAFDAAASREPGLLVTEPLAISPSGRPTVGSPGLYTDQQCTVWADVIAEIPGSVAVGAHLVHAGPSSAREPPVFNFGDVAGRENVWAPRLGKEFPTPPREFQRDAMDTGDIDAVVEQFGDAAHRTDTVGFDYLQIHAGANTLLGHYLTTSDGGLNERVAFPRAVVEAVRKPWPEEKPIGMTLPISCQDDYGLSPEEGLSAAETFMDTGCDIVAPVDVSSGEREPAQRGPSDFSDDIRNEIDVQTLATVPTASVDKVNTLIATGRSDLCIFSAPRPTPDGVH
jgi:anthraniloyl-CoA monooxygenase